MNEDKQIKITVISIIVFLTLIPVNWIFSSYMEAKSYNEATGSHITTWQAMWIELRVQSGPGTNENNPKGNK